MMRWILALFAVAIVAAVVGVGRIESGASGVAQMLSLGLLLAAIAALVVRRSEAR
jgi:uncharacterized membrane protein YtjA (UPF0391 family)